MFAYQNVFDPVYFLLFTAVLIVLHEWFRFKGSLSRRVLSILSAWVLAYLTYKMYFVLGFDQQWIEDMFAVAGILVAGVFCSIIWSKYRWGNLLPLAIMVAFYLSAIYLAISKFWNISGHVVYTTAPVTFLTFAIDKRYVLLYAIPLIMVVNRPIVGAHTWSQSICGFILGFLVTLLVIQGRQK